MAVFRRRPLLTCIRVRVVVHFVNVNGHVYHVRRPELSLGQLPDTLEPVPELIQVATQGRRGVHANGL